MSLTIFHVQTVNSHVVMLNIDASVSMIHIMSLSRAVSGPGVLSNCFVHWVIIDVTVVYLSDVRILVIQQQ